MTSRDSSYVFVYGTLKRGFPNYDESLLGKFYCGVGTSLDSYPLVVANQFFSPTLIDEKGHGKNVVGELYNVGNEVLDKLDELEGVGQDRGYYRILIEVRQETWQVILAYAYVKNRKDLDIIHSEPLSCYEIDKRYVHPSLRKTE